MASTRYPGSNVSAVKTHNLRAILLNVLNNEPAYRVKLAKDINVSTTTVTKLVDELISQGIIEENLEQVKGPRSVGRPQNALHLVKDARHAVGVHIGGDIFRVAIVNLRNEIVLHKFGYFEPGTPAESVMAEIAGAIDRLIEECGVSRQELIGVGVGAPGLVNFQSGVIGYAKRHEWQDVPVGDYLSQCLDLPVVVENNVRAMGLGEAFFGAGRYVNSLLFVYGRLGVGAGIVVDHQIHRGISLGAGEIGHNFIAYSGGGKNGFEKYQTLEDHVSSEALVSQARQIILAQPESSLSQLLDDCSDGELLEKLFQAVRSGDQLAGGIVENSALHLAVALVNAVNFINPEMILLGGIFSQEQDIYLPIIRYAIREYAFAGLGEHVVIEGTSFGWRAGILGASALALTHFFYLPPGEGSVE